MQSTHLAVYKDIYKTQVEQFEKDLAEYKKAHPNSIASLQDAARAKKGARMEEDVPAVDPGFELFCDEERERDHVKEEIKEESDWTERWLTLSPEAQKGK